MTDQLARLRAEIKADIDEHLGRIEHEERRVQVLREVLERMDRIEAECPVPAVPEAPAGRAPRRDLQAAVLQAVKAGDHGRDAIQRAVANLLGSDIIESAVGRTLSALLGKDAIVLIDERYYLPGQGIDADRRVPRAVDAAAE